MIVIAVSSGRDSYFFSIGRGSPQQTRYDDQQSE